MVECLNIPFFGIKKEGLNINKQNIFESSIFNHRMILTTINYNNIKYSNLIYSENDENWGKFSISNAIQNDYLILLVPPYIIIN